MKTFLKKIAFYFIIVGFISTNAQNTNDTFNYSEIARNAAGEPIVSAEIQVQVVVRFNAKTSMPKYIENHASASNSSGSFTVIVGQGTPIAGNYSNLPWGFQKSYIEIVVNGVSISNKEVVKPRGFGKLKAPRKVSNKPVNNPTNKNITNINPNDIPKHEIKIGDKTLKAGEGIQFFGNSPNHIIQSQKLNIIVGDGLEIKGNYPNLTIGLKKHYVGENYLGGKVAYVDETGKHGFVIYCNNYDNEVKLFERATWATFDWGESMTLNDDLTSNGINGISYKNLKNYGKSEKANPEINSSEFKTLYNSRELGYGWINTQKMFFSDNVDENIVDVGELSSIPQLLQWFNGKWFVPSIEELKIIFNNRKKLNLNNLPYFIWSSSESPYYIAQGIRDKFNGTNYGPDEYFEGFNSVPVKLSKDERITGVLCLNFSAGNEVTVAKTYGKHFFLIKEF